MEKLIKITFGILMLLLLGCDYSGDNKNKFDYLGIRTKIATYKQFCIYNFVPQEYKSRLEMRSSICGIYMKDTSKIDNPFVLVYDVDEENEGLRFYSDKNVEFFNKEDYDYRQESSNMKFRGLEFFLNNYSLKKDETLTIIKTILLKERYSINKTINWNEFIKQNFVPEYFKDILENIISDCGDVLIFKKEDELFEFIFITDFSNQNAKYFYKQDKNILGDKTYYIKSFIGFFPASAREGSK